MSEERLKQAKALNMESGAAVVGSIDNSAGEITEEKTSSKPENKLKLIESAIAGATRRSVPNQSLSRCSHALLSI